MKKHIELYFFINETQYKIYINKHNYLFDIFKVNNVKISLESLYRYFYVYSDKHDIYSKEFCLIIATLLNKMEECNSEYIYIYISYLAK